MKTEKLYQNGKCIGFVHTPPEIRSWKEVIGSIGGNRRMVNVIKRKLNGDVG